MNTYALASLAQEKSGLLVIVTDDPQLNQKLSDEIAFFKSAEIPLLHLPDWETLPYDHFSPHQEIISERLNTLSQLSHVKKGILILSMQTFMQKLSPITFLHAYQFNLKIKENFSLSKNQQKLTEAGYQRVTEVIAPGEFAVRGSLFDIFPMGSPLPYRIDLFDDEIESIRTFDPETQRTLENKDALNLLPAHEFPFDQTAIETFRQHWRENFEGNPSLCPVYETISQGSLIQGIEYYFPLFFDKTTSLFDYLPKDSHFVLLQGVHNAGDKYWDYIKFRYEELRHDRTRPILTPDKLYLNPTEVFTYVKNYNRSEYLPIISPEIDIYINHKADDPFLKLKNFLEQTSFRVLFCAESPGRREALLSLFSQANISLAPVEDWDFFYKNNTKQAVIVSPIETLQQLSSENILLIPESILLGEQLIQQRKQKIKSTETDQFIRNLAELSIGAPVVHIDHGVGRYTGLQTLTVGGLTQEFLTLEYANQDKLYVPVSSLQLISRYSGLDPDSAPLHRLGTDQWEKAKKKAQEQIRDAAAELLEIHAQRELREGIAHPVDTQYELFSKSFAFEETPDQVQAINDVINDMQSPKSMDRLICGDVGFGKTEVAMRAAFIAVQNGYQVAILVPTTLLAQQHFQNFSDRFAQWPFKVDLISRFRTAEEQKKVLENITLGKIDIIIGTHKLLQPHIIFKNLGLLIIDEEHRFGVHQKEKLKALRAEVDILTLTATPIPRTLNMSMSGMRDLSIIGTPPARRLSIKTFVHAYDLSLIKEAILREILRGGQVYYLHNDVETIINIADTLKEALPQARIAIAHGQMREKELEQIMRAFYHQHHNVLICTTIIETGIDIPSANTIIIERADKFGLAQLHQLRGRVGRSHHQAYAYLLTPSHQKITPDAQKRLDAITQLEDLGAGFALASHDLEIRGAGEILGEKQSGNIQEIGFSLYMDLLDRAVKSLKKGEKSGYFTQAPRIEIDLQIPAFIPEAYVPDVHMRLVLYKRLSSAKSLHDIEELKVEFIDRFGLLPQQTEYLFAVTHLKLKMQEIGVAKIAANEKSTRIDFQENPKIDPLKIIKLIQTNPQEIKLEGQNKIRLTKIQIEPLLRIKHIEDFIEKIKV